MIPLRDSHSLGKFPFWTLVIIALNIYFFYLEITSPDIEAFIQNYAFISANFNFSDLNTWWPLITSQFLHAGFLHIISNMLFLWIFGDNVEARFGFIFFPVVYLLSGVVGGLSQYMFSPDSTIPMLGASGAVAGVLGAYFVYFPRNTVKTLIPIFGFPAIIDIPASVMLVYWLVTQIFSGVASVSTADVGGVAFFAHIGGFATGWIMAKLFSRESEVELLKES